MKKRKKPRWRTLRFRKGDHAHNLTVAAQRWIHANGGTAVVIGGIGISDRVWTIGDLLDAALATQPIEPVTTAPDRRKRFKVIDGGIT